MACCRQRTVADTGTMGCIAARIDWQARSLGELYGQALHTALGHCGHVAVQAAPRLGGKRERAVQLHPASGAAHGRNPADRRRGTRMSMHAGQATPKQPLHWVEALCTQPTLPHSPRRQLPLRQAACRGKHTDPLAG